MVEIGRRLKTLQERALSGQDGAHRWQTFALYRFAFASVCCCRWLRAAIACGRLLLVLLIAVVLHRIIVSCSVVVVGL